MNQWTDKFSRHDAIQISVFLSEKIIDKIDKNKIFSKKKSDIIGKEYFKNLFRPSVYLGVSIFLERLLRVANNPNNYLDSKNNKIKEFSTYNNSIDFLLATYYNHNINEQLLDNLSIILNKVREKNTIRKNIFNIKNKYYYRRFSYIFFLKTIFIRALNKISKLNFFYKDKKIIYDGSLWLEPYFKKYTKFSTIKKNHHKINKILREELKENFKTVLHNEINKFIFFKTNTNEKKKLSDIFSQWLISSIPTSLLEGLEYKTNFYLKKYSKINFNEIHSTTSLLFNDEFKIFSAIYQSKGKILTAHDHGVNNFIKYFNINNEYLFTKLMPVLKSVDYYFAWGKNKKVDQWENVEDKYKVKIINLGSPYLKNIYKTSFQTKLNKNKLKIFYPGSPFKFYMTCLDEITPEDNLKHKISVCKLIVKLLENYDIEFVYKNFNSTYVPYSNDPIVNFLKKYIYNGRLKLTDIKPIKIIKDFDLVLLDMLSTTFAETLSMKVPALIFSNKFDYSLLCNDGKKINNDMQKNKLLFYEINEGYKCFENFYKNSNKYFIENSELFSDYQNKIAYPQNLKQYDDQLKNLRNKM